MAVCRQRCRRLRGLSDESESIDNEYSADIVFVGGVPWMQICRRRFSDFLAPYKANVYELVKGLCGSGSVLDRPWTGLRPVVIPVRRQFLVAISHCGVCYSKWKLLVRPFARLPNDYGQPESVGHRQACSLLLLVPEVSMERQYTTFSQGRGLILFKRIHKF